jgi:hypothetical protein
MKRNWVMMGALGAALVCAACSDDETQANPTTATTTTSTSASGGTGGSATGGAGGAASGGGGAAGGMSGTGGGITTSPCNGNTCDLTMVGTNFDAFNGMAFFYGLQQQGQMGLVYETSFDISGGGFSSAGTGVLQKGVSYNLGYFVDINGNMACDLTPTDAVWRVQVANVQSNLTVTVGGNDTNTSNLGCSGFP